jgi:predicted PurR-regulated permease PerM
LLGGQASGMVDRLPEALRKVRTAIESQRRAPGTVAKVQQAAGELERTASNAASRPVQGVTRVQIEEPLFRASDYLWSGSLGLLWFIGQVLTIIFLVFFLLASGDLYKRKLIEVVGPRLSRQRLTLQILDDIDHQIGRFLLIQALTSTLIGVALGISLWLLGVNHAAVWGVTAGILNTIPYFGTIIVTGALALASFLQFGTLEMVLAVSGITLFVTSIDGFLLTPLLAGRFSRMNNLAVFISLLFWGWLWGPLGMLLAVPIMMVIKSICDHIESLQPIGHLLGEGK